MSSYWKWGTALLVLILLAYSFVADHFQYLASTALLAGGAAAAVTLLERVSATPIVTRLLAGGVILFLGVTTWERSHVYTSLQTLWTDTLQKNPSCWMAYNNLGHLPMAHGELEPARVCFTTALEIQPRCFEARGSLGTVLTRLGRFSEARVQLQLSLREQPTSPGPYCGLGIIAMQQQDRAGAERLFRQAIELDPRCAEAQNNLGSCLASQGKVREAVPHFEATSDADPDNPEARYNLCASLFETGAQAEATAVAREALRLAETSGRKDLALALRQRFSVLVEKHPRPGRSPAK